MHGTCFKIKSYGPLSYEAGVPSREVQCSVPYRMKHLMDLSVMKHQALQIFQLSSPDGMIVV